MRAYVFLASIAFAGAATFLAPGARAASRAGEAEQLSATAIETVVVSGQPNSGPGIDDNGAADYSLTARDIAQMPLGPDTSFTDLLAQMPGVAIDQNQQIHIRDTEGPQFQYQINGVLMPLDINTNPPFLSMLNPQFVRKVDLLTGVLPARYSYATGGIVDIETKNGCEDSGGSATLLGGQRGTFEPSVEYGGCDGKLSYYANALYEQSNTAFSSATPGPNAVHNWTNQGQAFGLLRYAFDTDTTLGVVLSAAGSNNQLPNVPGLPPQFSLADASAAPSATINSYLNFRDVLGIVSLDGRLAQNFTYQVAYTGHVINEDFRPDNVGELIYQGVASTASHDDLDNSLEADFDWSLSAQDVTAGFYLGSYRVTSTVHSLVFPIDPVTQTVGDVPVTVDNSAHADSVVGGIYVNDLWRFGEHLRLNLGLRWDTLTGFTRHNQFDPTVSLSWMWSPDTTLHAGFARYMQVPSFLGISPDIASKFANTTGEGPPGVATPVTEEDDEWDAGLVHRLTPELSLSADGYYETTHHYLDTGQFGVVPIFAPFNYGHGEIWGSELAIRYAGQSFSSYANLTVGRNTQQGVKTGQFNFDPDELAFIDAHHIVLDHQPLVGLSAGASYGWKDVRISVVGTYSSGLRAGFADEEHPPANFEINASVEKTFDVPGVGAVTDRLVLLNVLDRVNLIRPAEGIGIFQSAYGPRFTVYDALTISF